MFSVENLTKTYRRRHGSVSALKGVSFTISVGEFVTITGGSGSGKSTLLLTLGGLIQPSQGAVMFEGSSLYALPVSHLADYRSRRVGFVLQTFNLIPYLNALENVMVPMIFSNNGSRSKTRDRATSLLARVGLTDRANHYPRELSVGQQQRVAIARALANRPSVMLADEPTGNLDPSLSTEILDLLKGLHERESVTVVMVTHSPEAAKLGNRRLHLKDGTLVDPLGECVTAEETVSASVPDQLAGFLARSSRVSEGP